MAPPGSYRNFLLGRSGIVLEHHDMGESVAQLQTLARLSVTTHAATTTRRSDTAMRLLLSGTGAAGDAISATAEGHSDEVVRGALNAYLERARAGNRRNFYDAMRTYFVLIHRGLSSAEGRAGVPELLQGLRQITTEYAQFLTRSTELQPEERLRYLFAAAGVLRNALGRIQVNDEARSAAGTAEIEALRSLLRETYTGLMSHYRQHLLVHPNGEAYTGILHEIQMREALLAGNHDVARQRALELVQWMTAHPPPAEDLAVESTMRWDYMAARALTEDPDFAGLVRGIDAPSAPENTVTLINGVSLELVQTVCASIDAVNEDSESAITARYRALASVVSVLSLTRPSASLASLLTDLRDPSQEDAVRLELENAAHDNAEVQRMLTEARGDVSLADWIERARSSARHVESLRTGAGRNLLAVIFDENRRQNPIDALATSLRSHPGLLQALGLEASARTDEAALRRLATELLRRGPLGVAVVEEYGNSHPDESVQGIVRQLRAEQNAAGDIGELLQEVLNSFQDGLNQRPDHELAAAHSIFQLISQTREISEGVTVPSEVTTQARGLVNRVEGYEFRTWRVVGHLRSGSSLATLGIGIVLSEFLPAMLIARAGASGRLALRGLPLVTRGAVTPWGSATIGIGTGLSMSLVGTSLHTHDRSSLGLRTHFWRDLGESALTNTVVFGATIPFSAGLSRWMSPAAEDAAAVAQLSRWRRLTVHAGSAGFGATLALGANSIWRRLHTGAWSFPSYDEVAENYLSLLAWEAGAAGLRGLRTRLGLHAELEGRRPYEALSLPPPRSRAARRGAAAEPSTVAAAEPSPVERPVAGEAPPLAEGTAAVSPPPPPVAPTETGATGTTGATEVPAATADVPAARETAPTRLTLRDRWRRFQATEYFRRFSTHRTEGRFLSSLSNLFLTQLGPYRVARIHEISTRLVGDNPQVAPLRQYLARQLALQEISVAGSLDTYTDTFLNAHRVQIVGRPGSFRMVFARAENVQLPPAGYNPRLLEAMRRHHIENAASTDADYLPRFLGSNPYQIIEIRVNPETGRIVGVDTHSLGDTEGSITLHCSYDPVTRQLRLPPIGRETAPRTLDLTPMIEAHRSSPVPLLWTAELGSRVLPQRLNQAARARINQAINDLNRDSNVTLLINADTGEILSNLMHVESIADLAGAPRNILRITGRYSGENKTLTIPAPRGVEGEYVLDMETGRFEHRLPETEGGEAAPEPTGRARRTPRRVASADADADAETPATSALITRHRVPNAHIGTLTAPARGESGPVEVTVYFGTRSGKILGISEGHHPTSRAPDHVITDNLPAPRPPATTRTVPRNRLALTGVHDQEANRITLQVPASEGQEAGTITIDLGTGRINFEATRPAGPGGGTPPPSDGTPPEGNPPAGSGGDDAPPPPPAAAAEDPADSEITAPRALPGTADITGPLPAMDPTSDVHAPLIVADILDPGDVRLVDAPNEGSRLREGQHWAIIPGLGEVSAFTEVGLSKHTPPRNEDAFGFGVASDGSLVAVVADGAGGSSTGEAASGAAVRTILERATDPSVSLGQAFRDAHPVILSDLNAAIEAARAEHGGNNALIPTDSYTVATGLRIESDGSVEVATVGDSQLWIARPEGDGGYNILAPYLPASTAGLQRAGRAPGATTTIGMNAVGGYILSRLGGGPREAAPPITARLDSGIPQGIFNSELTLPAADGSEVRSPFIAQAGDLFLMMSDGVHTLFNRQQMAETIRGLSGAEPVRRAIQSETAATMDLYRTLAQGLENNQRAPIASGRFAGNFIDAGGRIYDAETGGNHIGNASPDNVVLMVVHYDPAAHPSQPEGETH